MAGESKPAVTLPTYELGEEGEPNHFTASTSREAAAVEAKSLNVGDAAFIKRSDLKWTYAIITEKLTGDDSSIILRFEVDQAHNRKSFPEAQWGKYIRVIEVDDAELARLNKEAGIVPPKVEEQKEQKKEEVEPKVEEKKVDEAAPKVEDEKMVEAPNVFGTDASSVAGSTAKEAVSVAGSTKSQKSLKSTKSTNSQKSGSWFGGIFSGGSSISKKDETTIHVLPEESVAEEAKPEVAAADPVDAEPVVVEKTPSITEKSIPSVTDRSVEAPINEVPRVSSTHPLEIDTSAPPAADDTKENSDPIKLTAPATFLPSPKAVDAASANYDAALASIKTPTSPLTLKKKNSLINKLFNKKTPPSPKSNTIVTAAESKVRVNTIVNDSEGGSGPLSPIRKEWFDPDAREVDYDKNPTDLFQALEARQFSYADEMYLQINKKFNQDCKTWVVARGQKGSTAKLRFRALPLHAALVFGAPDDMMKKILNAYPKATRGRDVKGRLPIHLAMEHNASDDIVSMILEAFPKSFFAKDKKEMTPLDYVNGNSDRAFMKKIVPLISQAKLEQEHEKWEIELQSALDAQKIALKSDPVYMEDVIAAVTEDVEDAYATKMELLDTNYKKEILLLKKKHDSETQALLEGFEVKLNFERKLNKLRA